jgi:sulfatase maturation enzyme AslB (radical SAM superfamily)
MAKNFCVLPWTHMATWTDGRALLCCVAKPSEHNLNYPDCDIPQIWNSGYFRSARQALLKGEQHPACEYCWKEEAAGIRSHRQNENRIWLRELGREHIANLISKTDENGYLSEDLITFDFRLGNTCNLQCVMCRPRDSSKWFNDAKQLRDMLVTDAKYDWREKANMNHRLFEWYKRDKLWDTFEQYFPNIRHLIFAGGEPMLIREQFRLIYKLVKQGYSKNIELRYHTNGTILTDEIIELWKEFKKVELMVSIDAFGKQNDYVRYGGDWDMIEEHLRVLDDTPDNIEPRILATVHAMNVYYIPYMADQLLKLNFKKVSRIYNYLFHVGTTQYPTYMCTKVLPQDIKDKVKKEWDSYDHLRDNEQWKRMQTQLEFMMSEDHSHLFDQLLEYKDALDTLHGTDYGKVFPVFNDILESHR